MSDQLVSALVQVGAPIVASLFTALLKWVLPKVPKPLLPVISTITGTLVAAGGGASPELATALGLSSVGLREIVDQHVTKRLKG